MSGWANPLFLLSFRAFGSRLRGLPGTKKKERSELTSTRSRLRHRSDRCALGRSPKAEVTVLCHGSSRHPNRGNRIAIEARLGVLRAGLRAAPPPSCATGLALPSTHTDVDGHVATTARDFLDASAPSRLPPPFLFPSTLALPRCRSRLVALGCTNELCRVPFLNLGGTPSSSCASSKRPRDAAEAVNQRSQ